MIETEIVIWVVSFLSLYIGVFWLHVIYLKSGKKPILGKYLPKISIVVPALNEEEGISKTIHSLVKLDYPKENLEILVVDHGSKDKTSKVAKKLIKKYSQFNIQLFYLPREDHHIKSHAFNLGLKHAKGELVACVDADTVVLENCLKEMVPQFKEAQVGAVISTIKVTNPSNIYEKLQHLEYLFATYMRSLMSKIDTLHVTPGALSMYRKSLFDKYGPMDEDNVTEDLEMAMRLRYHGYKIRLAFQSVTYTKVPDTFWSMWNQRVRWFRGFIYNNLKYRKMMMSKKHGMMGMFQYPLNLISITTIVAMFTLLGYELIRRLINLVSKFIAIRWDYFLGWEIPTIKEAILGMNISLVFPLVIAFMIAFFIYHLAHRSLNEKWKYPMALLAYLTIYPFVRSLHWMTAIYKETLKVNKKW